MNNLDISKVQYSVRTSSYTTDEKAFHGQI